MFAFKYVCSGVDKYSNQETGSDVLKKGNLTSIAFLQWYFLHTVGICILINISKDCLCFPSEHLIVTSDIDISILVVLSYTIPLCDNVNFVIVWNQIKSNFLVL